MLAKAPGQITMADVMHALEGYVPPMECLPNPDFCKLSPGCALRDVWQQIDVLTQQILTSTTIESTAWAIQKRRCTISEFVPDFVRA